MVAPSDGVLLAAAVLMSKTCLGHMRHDRTLRGADRMSRRGYSHRAATRPEADNPWKAEDELKILVTGATGYVGGRLVPLLLEARSRCAHHHDQSRPRAAVVGRPSGYRRHGRA